MRRWPSLLLVVSILPSIAAAERPLSIQEVLLRSKPAVALVVAEVTSEVTVTCSTRKSVQASLAPFRETGTGWFISPAGWMITNAHVVSSAHQPPRSLTASQVEKVVRAACVPAALGARGLRPGERPDVEDRIVRQELAIAGPRVKITLTPSISVILANGIRLAATVAKYSPPVTGEAMSGRDLALLRLEASDMPSLALAHSDAMKIGDPLHILGFPGVVMTHELLNASARVEASVTNGAVSGFKQDIANQPVIQTDAPATWGNSGGPAVDRTGRVVGVLTFVSMEAGSQGAIVQGFNFVIPSTAVREFLKDSGVRLDESGKFNAAWHGGLMEFFAGNHGRAASLLAEANRLLPELPDVRRLSAENEERIKNPPPRSFPWAWVASALAVLSLGALAIVGVGRWKRNRFRIRPTDVARLLDSAQPPVILDARDASTYARSPVQIPRAVHLPPEELEQGAARLDVERDRTIVAYCT